MVPYVRTIHIYVNVSKTQIKRNLDERAHIRGKYEARWSFKQNMWEIHCPVGRWSYIGVASPDLHKAIAGLKKYILDRYELKAIRNMELRVDEAEGYVVVTGGTSLSKEMKSRFGWALRWTTKNWRSPEEHTSFYFANEHVNADRRLADDLRMIALWKKGKRDVVVGITRKIQYCRRAN